MKIKKIGLLTLITALLIGCGSSNSSDNTNYSSVEKFMDWYIPIHMKENETVGLSIALIDNQKIVWQKGFGYADKANNIEATPKTRYRAGSITKLFTGMATMKLVEEGQMDIDTPLKTYLPKFSIKSRFDSTDAITPRNIMTHHSGLPADWEDRMFAENPLPYNQLVDVIKDSYVAYEPNKIFSYSNLGVSLLGSAIEETSGELYADYVTRVLIHPMGMHDSDLEMELTGEMASKAYTQNEEVREYPLGSVPAGALNTTVTDLSQLAIMVNNQGNINGKQVITSDSLKKMFIIQNRDVKLDLDMKIVKIGLSWFIKTDILPDNEAVYQHDGDTIAHGASFMVAPDSKLGVVVLTNSSNANAEEIATTLLQKAWETKTGKKLLLDTANEKVSSDFSIEGTYISSILGGKINIIKDSNETYSIEASGESIPLIKTDDGTYISVYLEGLELYTQHIDGEDIIVENKQTVIVAVKVVQHPIPDAWQNRLGKYTIINQDEPKSSQYPDIFLFIEDGFLLLKSVLGEEESTDILRVINDDEAINEGLGRGKRETVSFKDGVLNFSGLKFKYSQ